jgi:hypothetical protein
MTRGQSAGTFSSATLTETTTAINPNFAEAVVVTVAEAPKVDRNQVKRPGKRNLGTSSERRPMISLGYMVGVAGFEPAA